MIALFICLVLATWFPKGNIKIIQWANNVLSTICMAKFPILQASFRQLFMENAEDYRNLTDFIRTVQLQSTTTTTKDLL